MEDLLCLAKPFRGASSLPLAVRCLQSHVPVGWVNPGEVLRRAGRRALARRLRDKASQVHSVFIQFAVPPPSPTCPRIICCLPRFIWVIRFLCSSPSKDIRNRVHLSSRCRKNRSRARQDRQKNMIINLGMMLPLRTCTTPLGSEQRSPPQSAIRSRLTDHKPDRS